MQRKLTDVGVRNAKTPKKYTDGGGMYLHILKSGTKCWRYNYTYLGKQKTLALGTYPEFSLKEARERHDAARALLARGIDPGEFKRQQQEEQRTLESNSFEVVAREWFQHHLSKKSESYYTRVTAYMEKDIFPYIGKSLISELKPPDINKVIQRIAGRGALDAAHRAKQSIGQVFRYAVVNGLAERDITADLRGALPPTRRKHFPALVEPFDVAGLLNAIDHYQGMLTVRAALKLSPLVMLRPGELRKAVWSELDMENKVWVIPIRRMKAPTEVKLENEYVHLVPLSRQAIEIFEDLRPLTGHREYIFAGQKPRQPISEGSVNNALKNLGYRGRMTGHGFRSTASSLLNEQGFNPDAIERQLAHKDKNPVRGAYNRAAYWWQSKRSTV
ncbi:MAG: integrase [Acidobacteria bacterium]|nr:MAG: integrase [Acidobacteriota bacterium]